MIAARIVKAFAPGRESAGFELDIGFETGAGTTVLFGPSGSGKTLTLDCIAGFVRPDEGRIVVREDVLFDSAAGVSLRPQRRRCGYVFQNYALFPHMTLRQNLEFAAARTPKAERHRRVNEMLDRFRLAPEAGRRPHELSGGQKQRCSIARALIGEPRVLLLDEPARGLDAPLRAELYELFREVSDHFELPVLLVTHDLDECLELGSVMLVLEKGRLVQSGSPAAVVADPRNVEVARLIGIYNLIPGVVADSGRVAIKGGEIGAPGSHRPGEAVTICVHPDALRAAPRTGAHGPNEIPADLIRSVRKPNGVRLEFAQGFAVETSDVLDECAREWVVEFPPEALKVLR